MVNLPFDVFLRVVAMVPGNACRCQGRVECKTTNKLHWDPVPELKTLLGKSCVVVSTHHEALQILESRKNRTESLMDFHKVFR